MPDEIDRIVERVLPKETAERVFANSFSKLDDRRRVESKTNSHPRTHPPSEQRADPFSTPERMPPVWRVVAVADIGQATDRRRRARSPQVHAATEP
jgi:hypothetical protein